MQSLIKRVLPIALALLANPVFATDGNEPPANAYLADSPWPMSHRTPYAQGSSPEQGRAGLCSAADDGQVRVGSYIERRDRPLACLQHDICIHPNGAAHQRELAPERDGLAGLRKRLLEALTRGHVRAQVIGCCLSCGPDEGHRRDDPRRDRSCAGTTRCGLHERLPTRMEVRPHESGIRPPPCRLGPNPFRGTRRGGMSRKGRVDSLPTCRMPSSSCCWPSRLPRRALRRQDTPPESLSTSKKLRDERVQDSTASRFARPRLGSSASRSTSAPSLSEPSLSPGLAAARRRPR